MSGPSDFRGKVLVAGDRVAHIRVNSGSVCVTERTIQRIVDGKVYLVPVKDVWVRYGDGTRVEYHDVPEKRSTNAVRASGLILLN